MCPIYKKLVNEGYVLTYACLLDKEYVVNMIHRLVKTIDYLPAFNKIKKELLNNDIAIFVKDDNIVLYKDAFTLKI